MNPLERLTSRTKQINAQRLERDQRIAKRQGATHQPPGWAGDGKAPTISLDAAYVGTDAEVMSDHVGEVNVDPDAPAPRRAELTEAQRAGLEVQTVLAARHQLAQVAARGAR